MPSDKLSPQVDSDIRRFIRDVPDFPKKGILFKDITPLLGDPAAFNRSLDALSAPFAALEIDAIVAIEARGFIFGAALAARMNSSFVPVRKPGKLPADVDRISYQLEYGEGALEMHKSSIQDGARILIVDDVLATGGTAVGAAGLVRKQGGVVVAYAFVIELLFLNGRERLSPTPITSVLSY